MKKLLLILLCLPLLFSCGENEKLLTEIEGLKNEVNELKEKQKEVNLVLEKIKEDNDVRNSTISNERVKRTYVPDTNFEKKLISLGLDNVPDEYVLTGNINDLKKLDVSRCEISDLTGIEDFTVLSSLKCYSNQLTNLDVSTNSLLKELNCGDNQLTSLNVSKNTALTKLECQWNNLTSLDVSANTALTYLDCEKTQLTTLDLSTNTALTILRCRWNIFDCDALNKKID